MTQTNQEIAGSARFFRNLLEGQGAPQNSFISNMVVISIPTAPTKPQETKDFSDAGSALNC
jgi:hypothetical protein